eukprot:6205718-Pleurochrysis_carterae.AAC.17
MHPSPPRSTRRKPFIEAEPAPELPASDSRAAPNAAAVDAGVAVLVIVRILVGLEQQCLQLQQIDLCATYVLERSARTGSAAHGGDALRAAQNYRDVALPLGATDIRNAGLLQVYLTASCATYYFQLNLDRGRVYSAVSFEAIMHELLGRAKILCRCARKSPLSAPSIPQHIMRRALVFSCKLSGQVFRSLGVSLTPSFPPLPLCLVKMNAQTPRSEARQKTQDAAGSATNRRGRSLRKPVGPGNLQNLCPTTSDV